MHTDPDDQNPDPEADPDDLTGHRPDTVEPATDSGEEDLYRIGTVTKITGIAVERLRAWERRYGLAPAYRAGKTRFYSKSQLDRLQKIKRLIDNGQPISSLVDLDEAQLDERLTRYRSARSDPAKTGLIGPNLLVLEQQQEQSERLDVRARWANMDAFQANQVGVGELETVIAQLPVLQTEAIEKIEQICPGVRILAIYQFATAGQIAQVEQSGIPALKWPASWQEIEQLAVSDNPRGLHSGRSAQRRFTDEQLIAIAASALSDPSGCPQHLVELVNQLNAFAEYAHGPDVEGEREQLMLQIHVHTTQARSQLEDALESLAIAEGLLPTPK